MTSPLSPAEEVALAWISRHLEVLTCDRCPGKWIVAKSQRVLFHKCTPLNRGRRPVQLPPVKDTIEDARSALWFGFADQLPGSALLRPLDEEEG